MGSGAEDLDWQDNEMIVPSSLVPVTQVGNLAMIADRSCPDEPTSSLIKLHNSGDLTPKTRTTPANNLAAWNVSFIRFPVRLYTMLHDVEQDGYAEVISWQDQGRSFAIHRAYQFEKIILPRYFPGVKRRSFMRNINLYGFRRVKDHATGDHGYYHESFIRHQPQLLSEMSRRKASTKANEKWGEVDVAECSNLGVGEQSDESESLQLPLHSASSSGFCPRVSGSEASWDNSATQDEGSRVTSPTWSTRVDINSKPIGSLDMATSSARLNVWSTFTDINLDASFRGGGHAEIEKLDGTGKGAFAHHRCGQGGNYAICDGELMECSTETDDLSELAEISELDNRDFDRLLFSLDSSDTERQRKNGIFG
jgi:HSF-type DNA-binding